MDVSSIWESEDKMASKLNKNPVMKEWYNNMTGEEYKKMLRNRISALKSRVKKKEEEKELYALRRMKQRLLMGIDTIISRDNFDALQEFDDSSYKKFIQDLRICGSDGRVALTVARVLSLRVDFAGST